MRGEFDQSTLYAFIEISKQTPFLQLIYTNKNFKKNQQSILTVVIYKDGKLYR
jgi:hypothetical protein